MWTHLLETLLGYLAVHFGYSEAVSIIVLTLIARIALMPVSLTSAYRMQRNKEAIERYNAAVDKANSAVYEFPKPTIAMIRGYCIGGGVGLALCCDLRICSDNSKFGVPAAKLGLGYGYKGIKKLVDLVGHPAVGVYYDLHNMDFYGHGKEAIPGIQLLGKPYAEGTVLRIGKALQDATDFHKRAPDLSALGL